MSPGRTRSPIRCAGVALLAAAIVGGCGSGDSSISTADAQTITRDTADLEELDAGPWRPVMFKEDADPIIVNRCGDPRARGRMPDDGLVAASSSPVLTYNPGSRPATWPGSGEAQVTVAVYGDDASAQAAVDAPNEPTLTDCVIDAIRQWYRLQPYDEKSATAETGVPLSDESIETGTVTTQHGDTKLRTLTGRFPEEVMGGFDNYHDLAETIGHSGPVVVTAFVVSNSQQGDPEATQALAQRLAAAALDRATAKVG